MLLSFRQLLQRDVKNYSDVMFSPKEKYGSSTSTEKSPFCCSLNRLSGHAFLLSPLFFRAFKAALGLNFKWYFNLPQHPEVWTSTTLKRERKESVQKR